MLGFGADSRPRPRQEAGSPQGPPGPSSASWGNLIAAKGLRVRGSRWRPAAAGQLWGTAAGTHRGEGPLGRRQTGPAGDFDVPQSPFKERAIPGHGRHGHRRGEGPSGRRQAGSTGDQGCHGRWRSTSEGRPQVTHPARREGQKAAWTAVRHQPGPSETAGADGGRHLWVRWKQERGARPTPADAPLCGASPAPAARSERRDRPTPRKDRRGLAAP